MEDPKQQTPSKIAITQHRQQPVELTARWNANEMPIVTEWVYGPESDLECLATISHENLQVGHFAITLGKTTYLDGDTTFRKYRNQDGVFILPLIPTAIRDVESARTYFREHIRSYGPKFAISQGAMGQELLRLSKEFEADGNHFATKALRYCYGRAWTVGSMILRAKGDQNELQDFGISTVPTGAETLGGCHVPSRIVVSQMQWIVREELNSEAQTLSEGLLRLMNSPTANDLHCMYVLLLMFARGIETIASDRLRHGRENGQEGPSLPNTVSQLEENLDALIESLRSCCSLRDYSKVYEALSDSARTFYRTLSQKEKAVARCGSFESLWTRI